MRMADTIVTRGPDDSGIWHDCDSGVGLAHRRLSILDLSPAGHQPMACHTGRFIIAFNGEIYNYRELKNELKLKGYTFHTSGDAEVIPAAYDCWGNDCLHHFDGMFAFALYHTVKHKMLLARDRFGEKPLYFHARYAERVRLEYLMFASEMKALWAAGAPRNANHTMMLNYLSLGYVQNPIIKTDTFFKEILNLPPGYLLDVETDALRFTMKRWYEPYKRIGHLSQLDTRNEAKVIEQFHDLLMRSVQLRLRSDVPVGTSLSGGLDSSSIVAAIDVLHKKHSPVEGWANVCFSAVFPGFERDESKWSEKAFFELGLLSNNDWAAKWISLPAQEAVDVPEIERKVYPVQYLRKTIDTKFEYNTSKMLQGCSKKRPDIYFELNSHCLIVEIDENQHNTYEDSCECARINEIVNGIGGKSVIIIRFNPDKYKNNGKSCNPMLVNRLPVLESEINKQIKRIECNQNMELLEVIELYYDKNNS
jgi:asparagine synthetase B (glutamine-hydrolysing)